MNKDCMTRRRKDNKLVVVSCSEERAWYWRVNEYGVLYFDKPARGFGSSSRRASSANKKRLLNKRQNLESCVWRRDSSKAFLSPCDGNLPSLRVQNRTLSSSIDWNTEGRVAQVQFVRHNFQTNDFDVNSSAKTRPIIDIPRVNLISESPRKQTDTKSERLSKISRASLSSTGKINLPSRIDIAHSHASIPTGRSESQYSTAQVTPFLQHYTSEKVAEQIPLFLGNTNPILIATGPKLTVKAAAKGSTLTPKENSGRSSISSSKRKTRKMSSLKIGNEHMPTQPMVHSSASLSPSLSEKPIVRKIQTNPYIAASKDERWVDPQTGLEYRTDLCQYLGHERKDVGRHTLTGVGQYTKTMLNIKVSKK